MPGVPPETVVVWVGEDASRARAANAGFMANVLRAPYNFHPFFRNRRYIVQLTRESTFVLVTCVRRDVLHRVCYTGSKR